ncbi:Lipopolysaccharide biosynthesis regulator YciM, contains six TPR domains and a predicted metal-binding C-terminal domain [Maridesulfovibrio ferrireducens]|uniref:Lipopolysaccharide biosynthesis regulator YciM, contains six TPR domains and a predicted metal-binding C-terminal domain n=1 Tax=Maridesulfovibrio ferrireducens TaxID=246191 RepID=A0A1G9I4B8_9BACT|nr:Lipopolysaccharide biosynthesis regulator YciM, contains six TPR domains and a predicted metal-binding C-terminal domain [Maridesulfovibrio ferrireducens]
MSLLSLFRKKKSTAPDNRAPSYLSGTAKTETGLADTRAAIDELSKAVKDTPEAVEIYLALGNLYRSQGEIERAAQIRNSLIVRPGLAPATKARALYELGRDFSRGGFLDRAVNAFEKAREIEGDSPEILTELAVLAAGSREFEKAASYYSKLEHPVQEAHYLARCAEDEFSYGDGSTAQHILEKALHIYPSSTESWLLILAQLKKAGSLDKFRKKFREALQKVPKHLRFVLVEGLLAESSIFGDTPNSVSASNSEKSHSFYKVMVEEIEASDPDVSMHYYGARLLQLCKKHEEASIWLEKTLMLNQNFWLARLELFNLAQDQQQLTSSFKNQLDFFVNIAHKIKRFTCSSCGFKRDKIFFVCPRCRSWHSITFRKELNQ